MTSPRTPPRTKNRHAVALARARSAKLTKERRSAIARQGALAMHAKRRAKADAPR